MTTQPITHSQKANFQTLLSAVKDERICLLSAFDLATQGPAQLICAVNFDNDSSESYELIPLAIMCDGNPYDRFQSPLRPEEDL